ncbi:MSHA biogenesis protein MshN [Marinobacter fuscus]|nr:MSHA biogenesis protein MshN [Marinobacter fuscus]
MSLLNDALRAAEQRQQRPSVSGVYTGSVATTPNRSGPKRLGALFLAVVIAVSVYLWHIFQAPTPVVALPVAEPPLAVNNGGMDGPAVAVVSNPPQATEDRAATDVKDAADAAEVRVASPLPSAEPGGDRAPTPRETPVDQAPDASGANESATLLAAKEAPQQMAVRPDKQSLKAVSATEAESSVQAPLSSPGVKQVKETAEAIDIRASRHITSLLAAGRTAEAEQVLVELTQSQTAPQSREIFAREMLVQDMPERARRWLGASVSQGFSRLRLLRARLLLVEGRLVEAVGTLEAEVPAAADYPDYRVTLATLLQQAGRADDAAAHWAELLAFNDSQAAWWLGLAIALETGGRAEGASKAYAQAAALPGLAPALADYAWERIHALQAGS